MVAFVVISNFVIGVILLYLAQKVWRLSRKLSQVAEKILAVEQKIHRTLYNAPDKISKAHRGTQKARQQYAQLGPRVEKMQQMLSAIGLAQSLWQRRKPSYPSQFRRSADQLLR